MYLGGFFTPRIHSHEGGKWASRLASNIFQFVGEGDDDNFSIITSKANISLWQGWQGEAWSQNAESKAWFHLKPALLHVAISSLTRLSGWCEIMRAEIDSWLIIFAETAAPSREAVGNMFEVCRLCVNKDGHQTWQRGLFPACLWLREWKRYINHQRAAADTEILRDHTQPSIKGRQPPHSHTHIHTRRSHGKPQGT